MMRNIKEKKMWNLKGTEITKITIEENTRNIIKIEDTTMTGNITIMIEIIKKDKTIQDSKRDLNIKRNKTMKSREENKINKNIDKVIRITDKIRDKIDNTIDKKIDKIIDTIIDTIIEIKIDKKIIIKIIMMIRLNIITNKIEMEEGIKEEDKNHKENWYNFIIKFRLI